MAKKKSDPKPDKLNFEDALGELEEVVQQLEMGNLALDETLATYEKGVRLLKNCHRHLGKAERKVQILMNQSEDGDQLEDFDDGATAESSSGSSPRRSQKKKKETTQPSGEKTEDSARRYEGDDDQILLF